MLPAAIEALTEELRHTGNPSSLHKAGRAARRTVEEAREHLAAALGARPGEVIFTASGTEADNLAIKGLFWARRTIDTNRRRILVSAVEHHAVLDPAFWMAADAGAEVVLLPVDGSGRLDLEALRTELRTSSDQVALISVMWANNEVGAVQPIADVVAAARPYGIPVHSDAVQAVGQLPVHFAASGLHAMSVSGHKIGGPVGVGALLARRDLELTPLIHGGGQERGVRSGTVNAAAIRAFSVAVVDAVAHQAGTAQRLADLRDGLVARVHAAVPWAVLCGPEIGGAGAEIATGGAEIATGGAEIAAAADAPGPARLPGNAHFVFPGCEGDSLLYLLDSRGVECSTGSACQAGVPQPSHVLLAMGLAEDDARCALRFSLGRSSTPADVDALVEVLAEVAARARAAGLAASGRR